LMTPTSFEFTVTVPVDARLVGAIRGLTTHAAGYAHLSEDAGHGLAAHVERAMETAIAATPANPRRLDFRFTGDAERLSIVISFEAASSSAPPGPLAEGGITVEWQVDDSRHVCQIRQRISP
jgi:hypothetical protein